jgi:hypothetical protein
MVAQPLAKYMPDHSALEVLKSIAMTLVKSHV